MRDRVGGGRVGESRRECDVCGRWVGRGNFARHRRGCLERQGGASVGDALGGDIRGDGEGGGRTRGRVAECPLCRRALSYSNMARHQRSCRVWDPGGGPSS